MHTASRCSSALPGLECRLDWGRGPFEVSAAREALRRQVLAAPDDTSLYEAYAALAIAEGDPRGEYVRLGLVRERAETSAHLDASDLATLDCAMEDLRARYGRSIYAEWYPTRFGAWLGRVASRAREHERFGFVSHVAAQASDVAALRAIAPLRTVELLTDERAAVRIVDAARADTGSPAGSADWARLVSDFPSVRKIVISNAVTSDEDFELLAALPQLESLTFLYRVPKNFAGVLARQGAFPALRSLCVDAVSVDAAGLARAAHERALESLVVEISSDKSLATLCRELDGAPLRSLGIVGIAPDHCASLDLSPLRECKLDDLRELSLGEYTLEGADALAESTLFARLRRLALHAIDNGPEVMRPLSAALPESSIRELSVIHTDVGAETMSAAASGGLWRHLESVSWGHTRSDVQLSALLATMEAVQTLEGIILVDAPLLSALRSARRLRTFTPLSYAGSADDAAAALLAQPWLPQLRALSLPHPHELAMASLQRLVEAPALESIGRVCTNTTPARIDAERLTLLQRRFGHRLDLADTRSPLYARNLAYGALPEPDLDPWG